jgi:hypothetical protein
MIANANWRKPFFITCFLVDFSHEERRDPFVGFATLSDFVVNIASGTGKIPAVSFAFDLFDLSEHVVIRRADFVIDLDEAPAHGAFAVDDISRGVRDRAPGLFVEQAVAIDDFVVGVREQREVEAGLVFQFVAQEFRFVVRIDADGEDFDSIAELFFQQGFQLSKLSRAPGSPVAAVKDQHD